MSLSCAHGSLHGYESRLSKEELVAFKSQLERSVYPRGHVVFEQGERPQELFLIHRGLVKITRATLGGREVIVELLFPGDLCGVMCALDCVPYPVSGCCLSEVELSVIPLSRFEALSEQFPGLVTKAVPVCREKMRHQRTMMVGMAVERAEQRAARILLLLADKLGRREANRVVVPRLVDRYEFAQLIGTTLETGVRILSQFRKQGIIEETDYDWTLLEEQAMREMAGDE